MSSVAGMGRLHPLRKLSVLVPAGVFQGEGCNIPGQSLGDQGSVAMLSLLVLLPEGLFLSVH